MPKAEHTTVDQALAQYRLIMNDVLRDNPDMEEEEVAHDCLDNLAWDCTHEVRLELGRTQLGYVPNNWLAMPGGPKQRGSKTTNSK